MMKMNKFQTTLLLCLALGLEGCGIYSFTGASIPVGTESFQVDFFENQAGNRPGSTVEPGLDRDFTLALQDIILGQTNLNLVSTGGDLIYAGEITQYSVTPMTSTANLTAAQNRLTLTVNLRFTNTKNEMIILKENSPSFMTLPPTNSCMTFKALLTTNFLKESLKIFSTKH